MQSQGYHDKGNNKTISKTLSWILRHGAYKVGLTINDEGFINVLDILSLDQLKNKCTLVDIERIVACDPKQRFTLRKNNITQSLEIKANQGHSIKSVSALDLSPIIDSKCVENVIHGTYFRFWNDIKKDGLSRMNRLHVHFSSVLPKKILYRVVKASNGENIDY